MALIVIDSAKRQSLPSLPELDPHYNDLRTCSECSKSAQGLLKVCSGSAWALLRFATLGSGKSGRCSGLETETESVKLRLESDFYGRLSLKWLQLKSELAGSERRKRGMPEATNCTYSLQAHLSNPSSSFSRTFY